MSGPRQAATIPDPATIGVPSMFQGANINNISGGVFTVLVGHQNTVSVARGTEEPHHTVEEILAMLQTYIEVDPWVVHDAIQEQKTPDTGFTFTSRPDIRTWIDTVHSVFWLKGGPGTGKTYLVSTLFDQLHKAFHATKDSDSAAGIAYLQFNAQMTDREIVMVLIMHLVKCNPLPAVLDYIRCAFAEFPSQGRAERPTFSQLSTILGDIVKKYRRCYIFIDGLDEMREEVREMLIRMLATLEANILIASRDLTALEEMLAKLRCQPLVTVEITAEEKDLDLYINQVIDQSERLSRILSRVPHRRTVLVTSVKTKSRGMFLHVKLQMEALRHCLDIRELFKVIEEIPEGIRALYSETWKRIERQPGSQGERAQLALVWVLHAQRVLSIEELQHAMAAIPPDYEVDLDSLPSKEDLVMICCGLLSIDSFNNVGFLHLSAQEILPDLLSVSFPAPHATMALTCISVLGELREGSHLATVEDLKKAFSNTPLLEYAYNSAPYHFRQAIEERPGVESTITAFIDSCQSFPYHHPLFVGIQHLAPLHVACMFGLPSVVKRLLNRRPEDCNTRAATTSGRGWSSLMIAAGAGQTEVVTTILDFFAACTSDTTTSGVNTLLAEAVVGHDESLLESLLGAHAQLPKAISSKQRQPPGSPDGTPGDEAPLRAMPIMPATDEARSSELINASTEGNVDKVRSLLATPGVDPNFRNVDGDSALMRASYQGYTEVVQLLLAAPGVDVNLCNKDGSSALMEAAAQGRTEVVKLLLATPGVDVNLCNFSYGNSALMRASYRGRTDVVKLLLAVPAVDFSLCNKTGNSALMQASSWGRTDVVKLLLAVPGVDVTRCNKNGDSALMQASYRGQTEVVKLLLAAPGIDLDTRNMHGKSALELASRAPQWHHTKDVVELLKAALSKRLR